MVLPVLALMLTSVAAWSRYQRDSMLDVLHTDYVRTARAKGVPRRQIIRRHALRNALIPFVTVVAIDAGVLLGGVVVVERVFSWPGLGLLFFDALERSDYPVILAWMAVATVFVVLFNLVADILYARARPAHPGGGGAATTHGVRDRMSMRIGDESGRARAEALDPALAAAEPVRHARRRRSSGAPRGGGSVATTSAMVGLGFLVFMVLACFVGAHFAPRPERAAPPASRRRARRRRTGSAPTS